MGLMFDDNNEMSCPECGCYSFIEREEHMLDRKGNDFDAKYQETERRYVVRCAECNRMITSNVVSSIERLR